MPERIHFEDQIAKNKWKSLILIIIIIGIFVLFGYVISLALDPSFFFIIMILAIIFSLLYTWIGYYFSDKIAVAAAGAKPASRKEHADFYRAVEGLTIASGLPMPRLYVMPSRQINAFASGRDPKHAVICVTEGALEKLDKHELEGVLAHELSHIANYDIRFMTLTAVLVGMIAIVSQIFLRSLWFKSRDDHGRGNALLLIIGILLAILAPLAVQLVQLAISRKREYAADASGIKFTRYPRGLIGALKKIQGENIHEKRVNKAIAPLFLSNPFGTEILSTHPPIQKRIDILEKM
jgi:heat shock protein HtpX